MNFLKKFLESLRNKPEKERVRIVFVLSLIVTLILIFLFQKIPFFKSKKERKREEIKIFEQIKEETKKSEQKIPSFFELFENKEKEENGFFKEEPAETFFFKDHSLKFEDQGSEFLQEEFYRE